MNTRVRVPIRINPTFVSERAPSADPPEIADAMPPVMDRDAATREPLSVVPTRPKVSGTTHGTRDAEEDTLEVWRDRALRLQAEMENFRKRQQRLADERIAADRERLLRSFLRVADDLGRALAADGTDADNLRWGVDLTHRSLMRLLGQEGVEPLLAAGQPFDPSWHEAVSTVPHQDVGAESDTVAEVVQTGYRLGNRLLRPARVVVAT
ncbi:MAG: nucleotide exchange factor GrpE [Chloroflexota bacterium]|nr:nucleotide exchange factor GrpE [Chloroflexota bacterium]